MKKAGCCTLCEKEVFEISQRFTEDPINRWPKKLGRPKDEAMRLEFLLSDGTACNITFCADCSDEAEGQMPLIWARCLEAARFENAHRKAFGAREDPRMIALATQEIERQATLSLVALTRTETWKDAARS